MGRSEDTAPWELLLIWVALETLKSSRHERRSSLHFIAYVSCRQRPIGLGSGPASALLGISSLGLRPQSQMDPGSSFLRCATKRRLYVGTHWRGSSRFNLRCRSSGRWTSDRCNIPYFLHGLGVQLNNHLRAFDAPNGIAHMIIAPATVRFRLPGISINHEKVGPAVTAL